MYGKISLAAGKTGAYDLVIRYQRHETEFAMDFLAQAQAEETKEAISGYLKRCGRGIKVRNIKIMSGAAVLAELPLALLFPENTGKNTKAPPSPGSETQAEAALPPLLCLSAGGEVACAPVENGVVPAMPLLRGRLESLDSGQAAVNAAGQAARYLAECGLSQLHVDLGGHGRHYTQLLRELRRALPGHRISFTASWLPGGLVPANTKELLEHADFAVLAVFHPSSFPGPASPLPLAADALEALLRDLPAERILLAVPGYGLLWDEDGRYSGEALSQSEVSSLLDNTSPLFLYDRTLHAAKAVFLLEEAFLLEGGTELPPGQYQLWFENSRSAQARERLAEEHHLGGTVRWPLLSHREHPLENNKAAPPPPSLPADSLRQTATITTPSALLHRRPAREPGETAALQLGAVVTVLGQAGEDWLHIQLLNGMEGYLPAEDAQLHQIAVVTPAKGTYILSHPWGGSEMVATLPCGAALAILDEYDSGWCKVMLADRRTGYLHGHQLARTSLDTPIVLRTSSAALRLRALPAEESESYGVIPAGEHLLVLDERNPDFAKVSYGGTVAFVTTAYLQ